MKANELTGTALDWAVAKCDDVYCFDGSYTPSTDWAQGGPIIERERMDIECWDFHSMPWKASMWWDDESSSGDIEMYGLTPLIAAMRCYVASKMGDEVEVPTELTQGEVK